MEASKCSVMGNSILVLDGSDQSFSAVGRLPELVRHLADPDFGAGAQVIVFICSAEASCANQYSNLHRVAQLLEGQAISTTYLARSYLSNGSAVAMSVTGLCAVADHVFHRTGHYDAVFVCDLESGAPSAHYVYRDLYTPRYNVAVGRVGRFVPLRQSELLNSLLGHLPNAPEIAVIRPVITVGDFTWSQLFYVADVCDPYLVCFVGNLAPDEAKNDILCDVFERAIDEQQQLLAQIVRYLTGEQETHSDWMYPRAIVNPLAGLLAPSQQINIVFARVNENGAIDARFYRQGAACEARLSGSGAVAAAVAAYSTGLLREAGAEVRGLLNLADGHNEPVRIRRNGEIWWLEAPATLIWTGQLVVEHVNAYD